MSPELITRRLIVDGGLARMWGVRAADDAAGGDAFCTGASEGSDRGGPPSPVLLLVVRSSHGCGLAAAADVAVNVRGLLGTASGRTCGTLARSADLAVRRA